MVFEDVTAAQRRIDCVLVAGGKWHDIDFARLELLKLLSEDDFVRVRVFEDYENIVAIEAADILVSYTCDVIPSLDVQERLRAWVAGGRRWMALHGCNSVLRFLDTGKVGAPDWAPHFMETLGTAFVAHPPVGPFEVTITAPDHPLVAGIEPFTPQDDELYLSRPTADVETLLHVDFAGHAPAFEIEHWQQDRHPLMYLRSLGEGAVLYNALGHCRGHLDMQPKVAWFPTVQRGAWRCPEYYELLRRGIAWTKEPLATGAVNDAA
ncbi:ThuA domain-containing protein [Novosphingobium sp. ERN07]|uniref:ThuA domain-containing protein n=1 Tax=Novosphingobium sp. ERN07 TaxID=2726187 RepID=UPI0014564C9B|nr:ThuA domain-containing protein [Novosphingobium sp. ERN07]NLR73198.1 ThuA domain-containing protein [Novosphingobium sp. ERN07]